MTKTMKQVQLNQYGSPDVLKLVETNIPQPKTGEVVIKVEAIGVNYSDTLRRRNQYFQPTPLPYVLGSEAVGQIISIGEGVTEPFAIGATVLAMLPFGGGYAEYVLAIAQYCVPLPPNIDAKTATAIFVQGSTAQLMISQVAKDLKDKTVLVNASAGGVGSLLVQLAKLNGAKVIAASSSDEKLKVAKANGADATVNYSKENWSEKVKLATNEQGVDIAFEMVGGDVYNETIKSLAPGGHLIVYGCASGIQGQIHPEHFVDENISQSGFNLAFYITTKPQVWQAALGTVIGLIAQGKLKIETPKTFALKNVAEAHRQIEARQTTGKVVLIN
ncbi:MAG TPA: zinc-binding dehydrogenase [Saprospiraceae bacterium]|nr:zinc-binding dehydrogenase [Saprospiraceae bacterium]HMP26251.1 zinc-binding dehydrogenase [Saprospiraceae bacterium]